MLIVNFRCGAPPANSTNLFGSALVIVKSTRRSHLHADLQLALTTLVPEIETSSTYAAQYFDTNVSNDTRRRQVFTANPALQLHASVRNPSRQLLKRKSHNSISKPGVGAIQHSNFCSASTRGPEIALIASKYAATNWSSSALPTSCQGVVLKCYNNQRRSLGRPVRRCCRMWQLASQFGTQSNVGRLTRGMPLA